MTGGPGARAGSVFLSADDVILLYAQLMDIDENLAQSQVRNRDGLESAVARCEWYACYAEADLATQAAVLAHGLAEGQHFIDGNKRIAHVTMRTFLLVNGCVLAASQAERADRIIRLAPPMPGDPDPAPRLRADELARLIRTALIPLRRDR
jgi:death-on-curing family protein